MKILIIFSSSWQESKNVGNTFSNLFGGNIYEIAHIYCSPEYPNTKTATKFFQITEKNIIKSFFHKNIHPGYEVEVQPTNKLNTNRVYIRWQILFWIRELVWSTGRWKTKELDTFITDFNPDLIFYNISNFNYINNIALYVKRITNIPLVGYVWDDIYSLKQFSLSPFYWIDRIISRKKIRQVIKNCDLLYAILESQQKEYSNYFKRDFKLLYKGAEFINSQVKSNINDPIKIIYSGNLFSGRWKTLARISNILKKMNEEKIMAQLYISSPHQVSNKIKSHIEIDGSSFFIGKLPYSEIKEFQKSADILLYVEPFDLFERYLWRLSFSTKIVDYFETARCILAVGWKGSGGITYLDETNSAVVVTTPQEIRETILKLVSDHKIIVKYSHYSLKQGKSRHNLKNIRSSLHNDFLDLLHSNKNG